MTTVMIETDNEIIITDSVYYNKEKHFLNYHIVGTKDYDNISNVKCKFSSTENDAIITIMASKIS